MVLDQPPLQGRRNSPGMWGDATLNPGTKKGPKAKGFQRWVVSDNEGSSFSSLLVHHTCATGEDLRGGRRELGREDGVVCPF